MQESLAMLKINLAEIYHKPILKGLDFACKNIP